MWMIENGTHVMITSENVINILNKLIKCDFCTVSLDGKTCSSMLVWNVEKNKIQKKNVIQSLRDKKKKIIEKDE